MKEDSVLIYFIFLLLRVSISVLELWECAATSVPLTMER